MTAVGALERLRRARPTAGELWTASLAAAVGLAGSFAVGGPTTDFLAVPVTDAVIAATPGVVTAVVIRALGRASEALAFAAALGLSLALLGTAALVGLRAGRRLDEVVGPLLGTYFLTWTAAAVVLRAPFAALGAAVPAAVVVHLRWRTGAAADRPGRRAVLRAGAGVLGVAGLATALGLERASVEASPLGAIPPADRGAVEDRLAAARRASLDVAGLHGQVTPVDGFYEVDINPVNPSVTVADWSLAVTGAVETPLELSFQALVDRPLEHRFATLRCVGEPLNGHELDTALWTGVPVAPLLEAAGPQADCGCVMLRAADGYYEEFPLAALEPGLLAFGMNGRLLPRGHGYPLRALVPGHWGEVNVKWLTEIEVLEREAVGYWEQRGWHGTGPVGTVAKLHAVNRLDDGRLQVGGHAYAGLRGVDRVEVSTDGGETWHAARLADRLPDPDTWRQWAYEWTPTADAHEVVVRAVEDDGTVQAREATPAFPSGATGWVSRTVRP